MDADTDSVGLLGRTYQLLDATNLTYREISRGTGLDREWLAKLKQRRIGEPGVSKVERLHDFLLRQVATGGDPTPSQIQGSAGNA